MGSVGRSSDGRGSDGRGRVDTYQANYLHPVLANKPYQANQ